MKIGCKSRKICVQGRSLLSGSGVTWSTITLSSQGPACRLQSAQRPENLTRTFPCKGKARTALSEASCQVLMRPEVGGAQPLKE